MRFSLQLRRIGNGRSLPINHLYEFSSWIYHVLYQGDQKFATWLHEQGYQFQDKKFRLFGFSRMDLRPYERLGDRLKMLGDKAQVQIGFALPDTGQHFLSGLFAEQTFGLGDKISQVDFEVEAIKLQPIPVWEAQSSVFRASNPICVSRPKEVGYADYLHPEEPDYVQRLYQNLMNRMQSYTLALGGLALPIPPHHSDLFDLEILSEPKSQKITIAVGTKRQTEVIGYRYDFRLYCDPSWREFIWKAGLGEKNSQGFGFLELLS